MTDQGQHFDKIKIQQAPKSLTILPQQAMNVQFYQRDSFYKFGIGPITWLLQLAMNLFQLAP